MVRIKYTTSHPLDIFKGSRMWVDLKGEGGGGRSRNGRGWRGRSAVGGVLETK